MPDYSWRPTLVLVLLLIGLWRRQRPKRRHNTSFLLIGSKHANSSETF